MPFKELGTQNQLWGKIGNRNLSLCKVLRDEYFVRPNKQARVYYDDEANLIGLLPDDVGYGFSSEKIGIRVIPDEVQFGRYEARFDEELGMVIIDLNKPLSKL